MFNLVIQNRINAYCNPFAGMYCNPYFGYGMMNNGMNSLFGMAGFYIGLQNAIRRPQVAVPYTNPFAYSLPSYTPCQTVYSNPYSYSNFTYQVPTLNYQPGFGSSYSGNNFFRFDPYAGTSYCNPWANFSFNYAPYKQVSVSPSTTSSTSSTSQDNSANASQGAKKSRNSKSGYGPEFLNKVKQISKEINCDYKDLIAVMNAESGISTTARNKTSGATGLIQFMPDTAKSLGTTTTELAGMSPIEQLDYVKRYLLRAKASAGISSSTRLSAGQLYTLIFLPARAGHEVLTTSSEKYYKPNKGLDLNRDGKITMAELDRRVKSSYVSDNSFVA